MCELFILQVLHFRMQPVWLMLIWFTCPLNIFLPLIWFSLTKLNSFNNTLFQTSTFNKHFRFDGGSRFSIRMFTNVSYLQRPACQMSNIPAIYDRAGLSPLLPVLYLCCLCLFTSLSPFSLIPSSIVAHCESLTRLLRRLSFPASSGCCVS